MITEFLLSSEALDRVVNLVNANGGNREWPRTSFSCRFIEPGLVHYNDHGTVLVQKPARDKMAQSFVGKPLINEVHKEVDQKIFKDGEADGIVTRVWYNSNDGWYWCDFLVWDQATRRNCESAAYSVSCAYTVSNADAKKGVHNNVPYEQEILDGVYTHLAVVSNPRYEGARIVYNSKGGRSMFLKFWKSKKEKDELKNAASEIDMETAVVEVDGKEVSMKELLDIHNAKNKEEKKIGIDSVIDVDGKQVAVKDLIDGYRLRNADDDDEKKKKKDKEDMENAHKNGLHNSRLQNCTMCNADDEDDKKKKKEDDERKNADEAKKKADELRNAAAVRGEPQTAQISSRREKAEAGAKMFGSEKK